MSDTNRTSNPLALRRALAHLLSHYDDVAKAIFVCGTAVEEARAALRLPDETQPAASNQEIADVLSMLREDGSPKDQHIARVLVSLQLALKRCEPINTYDGLDIEQWRQRALAAERGAHETTDDMQVLRGIVNNQAADREFLTVSMALLRRIVRAQEPTYNPETVASIKAAQASGGNAVCCQRFPNCECIPPKAQVKAGDPCPTFDTAVHEAHNGKCMYCGAPIAPVKAAEPEALTEAEQLLQAWADLLPPNGNLYWVHIEKARDYFKRRSAKEASAPLPPEVLANALQDVVHVDDGPVRAGRSVKASVPPEDLCLVAGCRKPAVIAKDGSVGALCEEHNGNVGIKDK